VGLTREEFAEHLGMKYTSMTNQLAPAKKLPKWAKSVLIITDKMEDSNKQ